MKVETVIAMVAASQDGKVLNPTSDYSNFILGRIDDNTDKDNNVDLDTLVSDFRYMVNELRAAINVIEK